MVSLLWCSSNQGCKVDGMPFPFKRLFGGTEPFGRGFPRVSTQFCVRDAPLPVQGSEKPSSRDSEAMKYLVILAVSAAVCVGLWLAANRDGAPVALSQTAEVLGTAVETASVTARAALGDAKEAAETVLDSTGPSAPIPQDTEQQGTVPNIAEALTVNGFDRDRVVAHIDGSELSALTKTSTKAALDGVRDDPDQLRVVLDRLRDRLGVPEL